MHLAFETLWRNGFNTLVKVKSLILGHSLFYCKPSLHLYLYRSFSFLNSGYFLGYSELL